MSFDLSMLFFGSTYVIAVLNLFLFFAVIQSRSIRMLAWWGGAYCILALSLVLSSTQVSIARAVTVDLIFALLFLASGLIWTGARLLYGRPIPAITTFAGALLWLLACQSPVIVASDNYKTIIGSLVISTYTILTGFELCREPSKRLFLLWPASCVVIVLAMTILSPIPLAAVLPANENVLSFSLEWFAIAAVETLLWIGLIVFVVGKKPALQIHTAAASIMTDAAAATRRGFRENWNRLIRQHTWEMQRHKLSGSVLTGTPGVLRAAVIALGGANNRGLLRQFRHDQAGSFVVITALSMPVLIGMVGLGTEASMWFYKHRTMQSAADSGAVSAATAYYAEGNAYKLPVHANGATASYGLINGSNGVTVTVNQPPVSGTQIKTPGAVEVIVKQPQVRLFSALWNSQSVPISARAVAVANGGQGCVLSLDSKARGAATVQGTAQVVLNGCSLYDDSSDASALIVGGSGKLSALSIGVVGGVSDTSGITTTQGIATGIAPVKDPYASVSAPPLSGCDQHNFSAKSTTTIDPGVYCGGMSFNAGANVTLNPGIYYIDQGSLSVNGGATVTGDGVTLVFTSSNGKNWASATINGGATVNLTPPTSGPTAGIVAFGDRNMTAGTAFKFEGGATQVFSGAVYLPKAAVTFAGGANTTTGCTQLIGDTVTFTGNSNLAVNCSKYKTKPLGSAVATLVE